MEVNLICVGKIKEKYILEGIDEYFKRLGAYGDFKIIELKEDGNDKNRELSIKKESVDIKNVLEKNSGFSILLDINGKKFSSEEFSKEIQKITLSGKSRLNFIIGGSYGVDKELKEIVDMKVSFSDFTFPHQLMRLIFSEQLYRWFSILNNGKYHK